MGQLSCLDQTKNIGSSACKKIPEMLAGMIVTPLDFELTLVEAASATAWQDAILAEKRNRIYLFPNAINMENASEESIYQDTPLATLAVRDGRYRFRLFFKENLNLHKAMFSFKGYAGRVFFIDNEGKIIGTSPDGVKFQGLTLDLLNGEKLRLNDGSNATVTPMYMSLRDNLELDKFGCMVGGSSFLGSLQRLTDVDLTIIGAPTSTLVVVSVKSALDNEPVLGLDPTTDFILLDGTGAAQSIASGTDNDDGTYNLVGVGLVTGTLNLETPAVLSVKGYESTGAVDVTI